MATYLGTNGSRIQNYTTNPDNPNEGEVWYNETDNVLKFQYPNVTSVGSWRTSGSLNSARFKMGGGGTQTAGIVAGGRLGPPGNTANTELYDGTSWTEVNNLGTARYGAQLTGTQTSGLAFGGSDTPSGFMNEVWNGTNWTEVNDMNDNRVLGSGAGADSTTSIAFGAYDNPAGVPSAETETWNGTNWTEVNDMNSAR